MAVDPTVLPTELLTPLELEAIDVSANLANLLVRIIGGGPTQEADVTEAFQSIHHIQHAIMAQAAARAYPDRLRLLGQVL